MDFKTWTQVLGIPGAEVVAAAHSKDGKGWELSVVSDCAVALCPGCKQPSACRHMVRWQTIRDLPAFGRDVLLDLQRPQFTCKPCNRDFTAHPSCVLEGFHATLRLAEALTDCINASTLSTASATFHLPATTAKSIFEKVVQQRLAKKAATLKPSTKLGVDEVHLEVRVHPPSPLPAAPACVDPPPAVESGEKIGAGRAPVYSRPG